MINAIRTVCSFAELQQQSKRIATLELLGDWPVQKMFLSALVSETQICTGDVDLDEECGTVWECRDAAALAQWEVLFIGSRDLVGKV